MKNNILYLETKDINAFRLVLVSRQRIDQIISQDKNNRLSAVLLKSIDRLLNKNKLNLENICQIIIYCGLGSFTSLRIGVGIANILAWGLDIPIKGTKFILSDFKILQKIITPANRQKHFLKPVKIYYQQVN